jgi:superfamily I DNA/RNA helicase
MKLNNKQKDALRHYLLTNKSIIVEASAGTGKSTLLKGFSLKLKHPGSHIFLAFTQAAREVMAKKMPNCNVRTTYSVGMAALQNAYGNLNVNKFKLQDNYKVAIHDWNFDIRYLQITGQPYPEKDNNLQKDIIKLVSKSLLSCKVDPGGIEEVAENESFSVLIPDSPMMSWATHLAYELIKTGHSQLINDKVIDFNEMIAWAAMLPEVQPNVYREVFIDEAQDLSIAQVYLVEKMVAEEGQLVAVGDNYQTIFHFAGASGYSLQHLRDSFEADSMPLTINYRCGKSIIEYAQEIDPNIEAWEGAPEGQILRMDEWEATEFAISNPKDTWFLCRTNSHLIRLGLSLMVDNIKFKYQRNVLEERLIGCVFSFEYKYGGPGKSNNQWFRFTSWLKGQIDYAQEKRNIDRVDLLETIKVLFNKYQSDSPAKFRSAIKRFFKLHSSKAKITLSTIHSAKGFEADTIIYWGTNLVPHEMAVTEIEQRQELNLEHIARTRAINNLILVDLED